MESAPAEVSTMLRGLELEAAGELHLARPIDCSSRNAEHVVVRVQVGCGEDMTIESIQQFELDREEHLFRELGLLDNAEVLIVIAIVADFACNTRNISKLKAAIVAGWAITRLHGPIDPVRRSVLVVKGWRRLQRAVAGIVNTLEPVELRVDVRIRPVDLTSSPQIAEWIDVAAARIALEGAPRNPGELNEVVPSRDAVRAAKGGRLTRLITEDPTNLEAADERTENGIVKAGKRLAFTKR